MTPDEKAAYFSKLLEHSFDAHESADFSRAEAGYREILCQFPNHAVTLDLFGTLLFQTGKVEEALEPLEKAVSLSPMHASAWNHLGSVRTALSDKQGALQAFQSAVKINPDNVDAWLNLSNVAELCEDLELSKSAAMNAAERFPENGRVQARLGAILTLSGSTKEALVPLSLAIILSPLDAEPYLHAAIAYTATGDEQAAENSIRKCLLITPNTLAPYPHLVELLTNKEPGNDATTGLGWALRAALRRADRCSYMGNNR